MKLAFPKKNLTRLHFGTLHIIKAALLQKVIKVQNTLLDQQFALNVSLQYKNK